MTTWTVSSASQLSAALSSASGGDKILLEPGNYGSFGFNNRVYSDYVTVRSVDPNNKATFTHIDVLNSHTSALRRRHGAALLSAVSAKRQRAWKSGDWKIADALGFPDATNTGVPAGVTLTPYTPYDATLVRPTATWAATDTNDKTVTLIGTAFAHH